MPRLTRWHLKSAMVFLVAALFLGVLQAAVRPLGLPVWLLATTPLFVHMLVVGWLTQMIFGVAYWMFPVYTRARPFRSPELGWAVFALLQVGLVLRVAAELAAPALPGRVPAAVFILSAACQLLAGLGFVLNSWGRVKER